MKYSKTSSSPDREQGNLEWRCFRKFAELHPDMVVVVNAHGVIKYISPQVEQVLGFPERRFLHKSSGLFLRNGDRARALKAFEFSKQNPAIPAAITGRIQRSDGEWIECEARMRNMMDDPTIRGVVVFLRNVTEASEAERAQRSRTLLLETRSELYRISNDCDDFDQFLSRGLQYLLSCEHLSLARPAAVYVQDPESRKLILNSAISDESGDSCMCEVADAEGCSILRSARSGKSLLVRGSVPPPSPTAKECPVNRYVIPIAVGSYTMGVLSVGSRAPIPPNVETARTLEASVKVFAELWRRFQRVEENARLASFPRDNPFPIIECSSKGEITFVNPAVQTLLWRHSVDLEDLLPEDHAEIIENAGRSSGTSRVAERRIGDRIYTWHYHPVPDRGRIHVYGRDVTEQTRAQSQLAHDAMHDGLTDLPNRNLMLDRISGAMGMARRREDYDFAVLLMDLDRFKVITDSMGHSAGDRVLKEVARRLLVNIGPEDTVGRLSGDEFLILLEDLHDPQSASLTAASIQERINAPMDIGGTRVVITASVGVVLSNRSYDRPEDMIRDADTAMHRAKAMGPGKNLVFEETMHGKVLAHLKAQSELRGAIENGSLVVYYQPVFSLSDLRVRGFEALVRWNHPVRGMIQPSEFISVAEDTGLIMPLGELVLGTVCEQLAEWQSRRMPLAWISVNLSAQQFQAPELVSTIVSRLDAAGANPRRLLLEITEGTAADNPERAVMMLRELKSQGIRIALDDFGTGYSSMAYLKRFPIDAIKLDRSFVKDLPESHDDAAIAESVIAMSQSLGMKVVAEGVENERQAMFLRSKKCDEVQGFLYGRPMPRQDATAILKKGSL